MVKFSSKHKQNVLNQRNKITDGMFRGNKNGLSFKTNERYKDAMREFNNYMSEYYTKVDYKKISNKHLKGFVRHLKAKESSTEHAKTLLSAVKKFNTLNGGSYELNRSNKSLGVEDRRTIKRDTKDKPAVATPDEIKQFSSLASDMNKLHHQRAIQLQSQLGLRVHEVMTLTNKQVEQALQNNIIEIKGKGGQIRHLELNKQIRGLLSDSLENKLSERFLYVSEHSTVDKSINQFTDYIRNHRAKITVQKITTHSFRRYYANIQYQQALEQGLSKEQAELTVSKKMGHNRAEVTRIYLR